MLDLVEGLKPILRSIKGIDHAIWVTYRRKKVSHVFKKNTPNHCTLVYNAPDNFEPCTTDRARERNYSGYPKKSPKGDPGGPFLRDKGDPWGTLFERKRGPIDFL